MNFANTLPKTLASLLVSMALMTIPIAAKTCPGEMPDGAFGPLPGDTLGLKTGPRVNGRPTLAPPKKEPAFRSLFVLVMPWDADRHLIEARRRLQFALRLDEPKEPALRVTFRF